jgi:ribosomal protein L11 methyltransferase
VAALPPPEQQTLKRYVVVGGEAELLLLLHIFPEGVEELDGAFAVYADEPPIGFDVVETGDVPDGWEDGWRSFHHGVQVGRFWVGPPWELPQAVPGFRPGAGGFAADASSHPETISIDPGRAFGTGAHPTTRLTLELLQELEPTAAEGGGVDRPGVAGLPGGAASPRSLLDIGCGSGVLSIAAAKLGFAPVIGIDVDEAAVEATRRNAQANGADVQARLADAFVDELPGVDVALANVALDVVERLLARLSCETVVTSGYLARDRPRVEGWTFAGRREVDGWAADLLTLQR